MNKLLGIVIFCMSGLVNAGQIVQLDCYSGSHVIYSKRVDAHKIMIFDDGFLGVKEKGHITEIKAECIIKA